MLLLTMVNMPCAACSHRHAERLGHARHRGRRLRIQRQPPADQPLGIEIAEDEVGIGHGRFGTALPVARRPRIGPGDLRADLQQAHLVDPADRAAAGAQRLDLDHRHADAVAQEIDVLVEVGHARRG
jgi:hypothetical protein